MPSLLTKEMDYGQFGCHPRLSLLEHYLEVWKTVEVSKMNEKSIITGLLKRHTETNCGDEDISMWYVWKILQKFEILKINYSETVTMDNPIWIENNI